MTWSWAWVMLTMCWWCNCVTVTVSLWALTKVKKIKAVNLPMMWHEYEHECDRALCWWCNCVTVTVSLWALIKVKKITAFNLPMTWRDRECESVSLSDADSLQCNKTRCLIIECQVLVLKFGAILPYRHDIARHEVSSNTSTESFALSTKTCLFLYRVQVDVY